METKMCMGHPANRSQCEKCARLPQTIFDEDEAKKWINWKKVSVNPCADYKDK